MPRKYPELAFTQNVKKTQEHYGSRRIVAKMEAMEWEDARLTPRETAFITGRDSFYMASVGQNGWPYVQFRGGPKGFLKVLDDCTFGYADYRGNMQYISTGNLKHDDRVALILMDYANRKRLKIMARASIVDVTDQPDLIEKLHDPGYEAQVERAVVFTIEAFDWNCPQHITPRWTEDELESVIDSYQTMFQSAPGPNARACTPDGAFMGAEQGYVC